MRRLGVGLAVLLVAGEAHAAIVDAKSCNAGDVQSAIDAAKSGDTIRIPSGKCAWDTSVTLDASKRELHLAGAGSTSTIIDARADSALAITGATGVPWTVSNLRFEGGAGLVVVRIGGSSHEWRFHHVSFYLEKAGQTPVFVGGPTYGLVDHIDASGAITHFASVNDDNWDSWKRPMKWGTADAVFIEDSTIACTIGTNGAPSVLDGERGGRAVFRHNKVINAEINGHGFDSGAGTSILSQEIYANAFSVTNEWPTFGAGLIRGGTALLYDNAWTIGEKVWFNPDFALALYRNVAELQPAYWGKCDGTQRRLCSNVDANYSISGFAPFQCTTDQDCIDSSTAHPPQVPGIKCKWKFCSVSKMNLCETDPECPQGETCTSYLDGPAPDGYPCFQQVGFGGNMASTPAYEWNNTITGSANVKVPNIDFGSGAPQILLGRDYFKDTQPPSYTPFPYPHPLQGGKDAEGGPLEGSSSGCSCDTSGSRGGSVGAAFLVLLVLRLRHGLRRRGA